MLSEMVAIRLGVPGPSTSRSKPSKSAQVSQLRPPAVRHSVPMTFQRAERLAALASFEHARAEALLLHAKAKYHRLIDLKNSLRSTYH